MQDAIAWVRANAIPLASVEAGHGFSDLEPLRRLIGDARLISLGEATHGTREFFQLKHRLLEFCVAELGFTIFGIEASYPECLNINDYVLHGKGSALDALASQRFWTWDTEEVLALIEWMRAWNLTHARQVKFYGFDMQFPTEAALNVLDYLGRVAPDLAKAGEHFLAPLCDDLSAAHFHLAPAPVRKAAFDGIARILAMFEGKKSAWISGSSDLDWRLARLNAIVLEQSARLRLMGKDGTFSSRDIAMAENVRALLDIEGPQSRAVLWAHNGHVARETSYFTGNKVPITNMGSRLHEMFGPEYVVVGFAFNQGSFQAIEPDRGLVDHTVTPAPDGSLDHTLAAAGIPAFLLDLKAAPADGPISDWLASKPISHCIGAVYSAEDALKYLEAMPDPRRTYDALAFVETTTAARANRSGQRGNWPKPEATLAAVNLELAGDIDVPMGWTWAETRRLHAYRIALEDAASPSGARAVRIERASAPWRWGEGRLEQTLSAEAWCGKRLRLSAAVRTDTHGPGNGAQLCIEVRPKPPEGVAWMMPASAVATLDHLVQSPDWARHTIEIDVPANAHKISIGLALAGTGTAWFGDLDLQTA